MRHLDEGTIHAWIDREVDAAEAARVEAHLAACGACAARAAHARGLAAGASRIVGTLDGGLGSGDRALGAASRRPQSPVSSSLWRRMRLTPARAAAASIAIVALGSALAVRQARRDTKHMEAIAVARGALPAHGVAGAPVRETLGTVPPRVAAAPEPAPRRQVLRSAAPRVAPSSPRAQSLAEARAAEAGAKAPAPTVAATGTMTHEQAAATGGNFLAGKRAAAVAGAGVAGAPSAVAAGARTSNVMAFDAMSGATRIEGCWTVLGDSLPVPWLPRRLTFDTAGMVRQANGEVWAGVRWRAIVGGGVEVDGSAPTRPLLTVTRRLLAGGERLTGTIHDEERDMSVILRRCE